MTPTRQRREVVPPTGPRGVDGHHDPATRPSDQQALRARVHAAIDALLDGLDAYRRAPLEEDLVRVRDLPIEARARTELVTTGALRAVKLGRELWTRRSWLAAAVDALPPAHSGAPVEVEDDDEVTAAARRRALRRVE